MHFLRQSGIVTQAVVELSRSQQKVPVDFDGTRIAQ